MGKDRVDGYWQTWGDWEEVLETSGIVKSIQAGDTQNNVKDYKIVLTGKTANFVR